MAFGAPLLVTQPALNISVKLLLWNHLLLIRPASCHSSEFCVALQFSLPLIWGYEDTHVCLKWHRIYQKPDLFQNLKRWSREHLLSGGQQDHCFSPDSRYSLMFPITGALESLGCDQTGLWSVVCSESSVSMNLWWTALQGGEAWGDEERAVLFVLGARLNMAGPVDLQGFCLQKLVNISEALTVY